MPETFFSFRFRLSYLFGLFVRHVVFYSGIFVSVLVVSSVIVFFLDLRRASFPFSFSFRLFGLLSLLLFGFLFFGALARTWKSASEAQGPQK